MLNLAITNVDIWFFILVYGCRHPVSWSGLQMSTSNSFFFAFLPIMDVDIRYVVLVYECWHPLTFFRILSDVEFVYRYWHSIYYFGYGCQHSIYCFGLRMSTSNVSFNLFNLVWDVYVRCKFLNFNYLIIFL